MGDPRKFGNKYSKPKKLFDKARIGEESGLKHAYGLKNMRELWVAVAELKKARREARRLLSLTVDKRDAEKSIIMNKLMKIGVIGDKANVEDILSLTVKDILERRLQTQVFRKGLSMSILQSRQLITHGFITIKDRRVSIPSYTVSATEEPQIRYTRPIQIIHKYETKPAAAPAAAAPAAVPAPAPAAAPASS
jgi:small subunit ribosomal protein S4